MRPTVNWIHECDVNSTTSQDINVVLFEAALTDNTNDLDQIGAHSCLLEADSVDNLFRGEATENFSNPRDYIALIFASSSRDETTYGSS
jgi:hypothetical protein